MQYEYLKLDAPAANAAGVQKQVQRHSYKAVYFAGTFDASLTVEVCADEDATVWAPAPVTAVTGGDAPCVREFTTPCYYVRVVTSGYNSGTPNVWFAGHDPV